MCVGLVGLGFVGSALYNNFSRSMKVETFDINKESTCSSLRELASKSEVIFVCVPTPMKLDGSCDTSIVEKVVDEISVAAWELGRHIVVVIKSTVPPGTTSRLNYSMNVTCVFNPEFLTEANAQKDFDKQDRIILGGVRRATNKVAQIYHLTHFGTPIYFTDSTTAELVKYITNCFLAVKVSFANEIYALCEKLNIKYDEAVKLATLDERLGNAFWKVPGPDGKLGAGGVCLPKDLNAILSIAKMYGVPHHTMQGAWETNIIVRPEKDWENFRGRAVSE